jgi:hypothetical protein
LQLRNEQGLFGLLVEILQQPAGLAAAAERDRPITLSRQFTKAKLGSGNGADIRGVELMARIAVTIHYNVHVHGCDSKPRNMVP